MPRHAIKRRPDCRLLILFLSALISAPAAMSQVAEAPESADHAQMGVHHMNFPMGFETCAPSYTYKDGPVGPGHWPGVCATGNMQSPVDIRDPQPLPIGGMLKFSYAPVDLDVIDDCN